MDMWFKFEQQWNNTNYTIPLITNITIEPIDMEPRLITVIQFSIIGSLGILVNLMPVIVTALGLVKRNVVNGMVVNLACCELMLDTSFVFGQSFFVLWREWLDTRYCHFLSFIHFVAAFASFMFPPMLAVNRHIALYHEAQYKRIYTKKRTIAYMVLCWSFCTIVPLIFLIAQKTGFDEDNDHCCMVVKDTPWIVLYWLIIIAPLLTLCDGIMIYCNFKIYQKLKGHASENSMTTKNVVRDNKELLYFLLADMSFPICFHSVYHILKFILVNRTSEFLKRFFISLYLVNSICRGVVTLAMLRPYRKAVLQLFCRKNQMSSVHPTTTASQRPYEAGRRRSTAPTVQMPTGDDNE